MIDAYLSTFSIVSNSGVHASGLYRAAHGYGFLKISRDPAIEDFNYMNVCLFALIMCMIYVYVCIYVCMYVEDFSAFKTLSLCMYVCMYVFMYVFSNI